MAWTPTAITVGDWGRLQISINDTDVTFFRDVPTKVESWSSGDPFGDATAVISFPQISPFEKLGTGPLTWLMPHASVDILLQRTDGTVVPLFEGMVASFEDDLSGDATTFTVQCIGALYQLDYYVQPPKNLSAAKARLYEDAIAEEFPPVNTDRPGLRLAGLRTEYPTGITDTALMTRYSGAWEKTLTGYIQRLLADMVHNPAMAPGLAWDQDPWEGSWTLMKDPGRVPVLKIRDEASVDWTVSMGAPGVEHSLKSDYTQAFNVIYGEGTDESGTTWRNSNVEVDADGETVTSYYPMAWIEAVYPAKINISETGEPTDPAPLAYHPENVRIENITKFGAGVSLIDAQRAAKQQILRETDPGWFGSITLRTDPEEGSRFEIAAGSNIFLRWFRKEIPPRIMIYEELLARGVFNDPQWATEMTRGMMAAVLVRLMADLGTPLPAWSGTTHFSDVNGIRRRDQPSG